MKSILKNIVVFIIELEARLVLKKYKPRIVAVTGSVGKTGTKDAIYSVLSKKFFVRKSDKSFNSEIGIPLTILGCPNGWYSIIVWLKNIFEGLKLIIFKNHYPKWIVLEVGADRPGDIQKVSKWLSPDIVVITRMGEIPVHVEFFDSPEDLIKEKEYLVKALKKDGLLILNNDDQKVSAMGRGANSRLITYGFNDGSKIKASNDKIFYRMKKGRRSPEGISFKVDYIGSSVPVRLMKTFGKHQIYSALAAVSVGVAEGINMINIIEALSSHETPPGRLKIIEGINGSLILDDSYNSSPIATEAALETLDTIEQEGGRKIAVLGDMLELGRYSADEHKKIGKLVAPICQGLITVGLRSKGIANGANIKHMHRKDIFEYSNAKEAGEFLKNYIEEGDIILIKGSQSMRMEKVVEAIMAHPEKKEELLIRQEEIWNRI